MLFGTESFEFEILKGIQSFFGCSFMDLIMPKVSSIGNMGYIWIIMGFLMLCLKKYRRTGIILLTGLFLGVLIGNAFLKNVIARPRPCWIADSFPLLIANPIDFSFPSGHTLSSFISAFVIYNGNKKLGAMAFALALLIAFSRMYLFVHFPTDILAGIILAFAITRLMFLAADKTFHSRV